MKTRDRNILKCIVLFLKTKLQNGMLWMVTIANMIHPFLSVVFFRGGIVE